MVALGLGLSGLGLACASTAVGSGIKMDEASKKFIEDNRWPLAQQSLDRAGHAANTVRGLLFSAAAAGIGFVVYDRHGTALVAHVVPLILLGFGAALTFASWDIQKGKALRRFEALRDGKFDYDEERGARWYRRNYILDRIAAGLIAAGAIAEIIIRIFL